MITVEYQFSYPQLPGQYVGTFKCRQCGYEDITFHYYHRDMAEMEAEEIAKSHVCKSHERV